jgi:hypothetical protein
VLRHYRRGQRRNQHPVGPPFYQFGPGVTNPYTTYGNGTTNCALAPIGTPCREIPDISADADGYTAYAEYCTGNASTPGTNCGTPPIYGWFQVAGTSASAPFWAGIIADRVGYFHGTNSAGTQEWLAATREMRLSTAEPVFTRSQTTIVSSSDEFTKQNFESTPKKVSRRVSSRPVSKKK